jgi:beta-barrel assembly-enhancing protease
VTAAIFFDGQTATDRPVNVRLDASGLSFSGDKVSLTHWAFGTIETIDPFVPGRPLRLASRLAPGARLVIADDEFNTELIAQARHLRGGINVGRLARLMAWIFGGLALVALATYFTMQFAPKPIAFLLPDKWRDRVGEQIEASLTEGAKICSNSKGQQALSAMMARIIEGNPDLPPIQVRVYDIPIMNAFAMPGDRIVMTSELIARAEQPEEVAGVLAHELGHVVNRHSEAQLVRVTGMQILFAIVTGGGGGDTISQFAGLAAILSYSRAAEEEADEYAIQAMTASAIDPLGLKSFFEKVLAEEKGGGSGKTFGQIGEVFATHPGTEERIGKIPPLPAGVKARPVMSEEQWQALKGFCRPG